MLILAAGARQIHFVHKKMFLMKIHEHNQNHYENSWKSSSVVSVVVVLRPSSVPSVRRRRPSSSSVRPSRPSVAVVRRRQPANPRSHAIFRKKHQNMSPTASWLWNSESTRKILQIPWVKIEKGAGKVCFMDDLLFHKNFGPNVDNISVKIENNM